MHGWYFAVENVQRQTEGSDAFCNLVEGWVQQKASMFRNMNPVVKRNTEIHAPRPIVS